MRPKERRESGQTDLLRSRLDQILNMDHALVKLTRSIDWRFLEQRLGAVYDDDPGRPPLPTRLMTGLAILKSMHNLSDEALCERWLENPYYQLLCGEEFFQHRLPFDRSSLTRWHLRMGEERLMALLQESLAARRCPAIPMTATRWPPSFPPSKPRSAPVSVRSSPMPAIAATMRRRTCSRSMSPATGAASPKTIKRALRRRAAVEPVIGHLKQDHRMGHNFLAFTEGDANNAMLAGYNFSLLLNWLRLLFAFFLALLATAPASPVQPRSA